MPPLRRLKHAFLVVAGSMTMHIAAQNTQATNAALTIETNIMDQDKKELPDFDYAFGDQTAASLGLPGTTGSNWGVADTWYAFKEFIKENPNALKGKNVFVAIGNSGMVETLLHGPQMAKRMIDAVGDQGNIVLLGVSETRTDMDGKWANDLIQKKMKKYGGIYGGPMIQASSPQNVYPTKVEEFTANKTQARIALKDYLNRAKKLKAKVSQKSSFKS